jgi:hypothetical protein
MVPQWDRLMSEVRSLYLQKIEIITYKIKRIKYKDLSQDHRNIHTCIYRNICTLLTLEW